MAVYQDSFSNYERGLQHLIDQLGSEHPRLAKILTQQHRLKENMDRARRFGDTETRRSERAEIIEQLNRIALAELGVSFNDLCRQSPPSASPTKPPAVTNTTHFHGPVTGNIHTGSGDINQKK